MRRRRDENERVCVRNHAFGFFFFLFLRFNFSTVTFFFLSECCGRLGIVGKCRSGRKFDYLVRSLE